MRWPCARWGLVVGAVACASLDPVPADPMVTYVEITPAAPRVGDAVAARVEARDPEGAELSYRFTWTVDDQVVQEGPRPTLAEPFAKGQTLGVAVVAVADDRLSAAVSADPVAAVNTPPSPGAVVVGPTQARAYLTDLVCTPEAAADADGDALSWTMRWRRDDLEVTDALATTTWPGDTVPAAVLREGDVWVCEATVTDGEERVTTRSTPRTVDVGVPPQYGVPVAGGSYACLLDEAGLPTCWGEDGDDRKSSPPTDARFARIYPGLHAACGLVPDDLSLRCWGRARHGLTTPPAGAFVDVSIGLDNACAIRVDGTLDCWGLQGPVVTEMPEGPFTKVVVGTQSVCAIDASGALVCWAGFGGPSNQPPEGVFVDVTVAGDHGCALEPTGRVQCWGADTHGEATPPDEVFVALGARIHQTCGLRADGAVQCWGDGADVWRLGGVTLSQRLGLLACVRTSEGAPDCVSTFQREGRQNPFGADEPPTERWEQLAAGRSLVCGLDADGYPECFGLWGALGLPDEPFDQLAVGADTACGLRTDGSVRCWGLVDVDGVADAPDEIFVEIDAGEGLVCGRTEDDLLVCWGHDALPPPSGTFRTLAVGRGYGCGIRTDDTLACWGTSDRRAEPPSGVFVDLDIDGDLACARDAAGAVTCWGLQVPESQVGPFRSVSVAKGSACGILRTGQTRCWGPVSVGRASPPPSLGFVETDGGSETHCALDDEGKLFCWGAIRRTPLP